MALAAVVTGGGTRRRWRGPHGGGGPRGIEIGGVARRGSTRRGTIPNLAIQSPPAAMPVRRRQPRRQETGAAERYGEMGIAAALSRPWDYPTACGELAALLRLGYADLPKAAQALVASDVLLAFRLLPE